MSDKFETYIREVRLIDDSFFEIFFKKDPKYIETVIQAIFKELDRPLAKIKTVTIQHKLNSVRQRGICLDALAIDEEGKRINIEVQRSVTHALVKRARYHSAMIDTNTLEQGKDFDELPENYVIFITEKDFRGDGKPLYQVERFYVDQKDKSFGDGTHIIFVNGQYREKGTVIGDLMHDFFSQGADEMRNSVLAEGVRFFKNTEEGHKELFGIDEAIRAEGERIGEAKGRAEGERVGEARGIDKGRAEEKLDIAQNLVRLGQLSLEMIAKATGLSVDELKKMEVGLKPS